jgi:hypothetical protein
MCKANKAIGFLIGETVLSTDWPDHLHDPAFPLGGPGSDV